MVNREALLRTADWLEANPDKHITGSLAISDSGFRVNPLSEDAVCFCALGRLAKELNYDPKYGFWADIVAAAGVLVSAGTIWRTNDLDEKGVPATKGRPEVITLLRELAA